MTNNTISDLTYKVLAFSELVQVETMDCIDWALEMLDLGYHTSNLLRLSQCHKTNSYFEVKPILEKAAQELGLEIKVGENAILSYCSYYVKNIAKGFEVRQNLKYLSNLFIHRNDEDCIHDFFLLYNAWDQIDENISRFNFYWEGANKNNIEAIVFAEAKKWLEKYKEHYIQNIKNLN